MDIRTIARLANVSIATVSRTINRVSTVNPKMAKRVAVTAVESAEVSVMESLYRNTQVSIPTMNETCVWLWICSGSERHAKRHRAIVWEKSLSGNALSAPRQYENPYLLTFSISRTFGTFSSCSK